MAYPKTITFNDSDNRVIVDRLPSGRFIATDPDHNDVFDIEGAGDTELAAIADLERQIREAE